MLPHQDPTEDPLKTAFALHQQGHLDQAEALYNEILQVQPRHAEALQLLGTIALQRKDHETACALFDKALALDPHHVQARTNRGHALRKLNRHAQALADFEQAVKLQPGNAEAHHGRGTAQRHLGQLEAALESYKLAIQADPEFMEAHINSGSLLRNLNRLDEAVACYARLIKICPTFAAAHSNLGNVLLDLKRPGEAIESYGRALALHPNNAVTRHSMGLALRAAGRPGDAMESFEHAVAIDPAYLPAIAQKGVLLLQTHQFAQAAQCFESLLALQPDNAEAHGNRARALSEMLRDPEAVEVFDRALEIEPAFAEARWSQSLCWLRLGDFERGWKAYEWRQQATPVSDSMPVFREPMWLGEDAIDGKTLLVQPEQGFGDVIQFCRYVPLLAACNVRVVLPVNSLLHKLLGSLKGVHALVLAGDKLPAFDLYTPLMSLPLAFQTRLDSVPCETPYLFADAQKVQHWRRANMLARPRARMRIGLAWSGNTKHKSDSLRSIPLEQFSVIAARVNAVTDSIYDFVCLHNELRTEAESQTCLAEGIRVVSDGLTTFADTAALIESLDLVITVDTSIAHLAGALGKPVWILLAHSPDYRWLLDRTDSPWYPTARLFRQPRFGDWAPVLALVQSALADLSAATQSPVAPPPARPVIDPLDTALELHQQGHLDQAEALYTALLRAQPRHAQAMHLLGTIALQRNDCAGACGLFDQALALDPTHVQAHLNRGHALRQLHRHAQALQSYASAIDLQPENVEAHRSHGLALRHLGRFDEALAAYDRAIALSPANAEAHNGRGTALRHLQRHDEAVASFEHAIKHKPTFIEAHNNIGIGLRALKRYSEAVARFDRLLEIRPDFALAHANRGNALLDMKRHDEAIGSYGRALALNSTDANTLSNMGTALSATGRHTEAMASFERALLVDPAFAPTYNNKGSALLGKHLFTQAIACFDAGLQLQPWSAETHCNRGNALFELMRHEEALQSYATAININPHSGDAHWNEALCRLRLGDFDNGWQKFEWRWKASVQQDTAPTYLQPVWLGKGENDSLQGKTLLVHPEQGFGDLIQFCRYVPLLAAHGARVILAVHPALKEICSSLSGVSALVTSGDPLPTFDVYTPLMSLPMAFKTRLESIPATVPYLFADDARVAQWRQANQRAKPHSGLRIGLAWAGSAKHKNDAIRSIPFDAFSGIASSAAERPTGGDIDYVCLHNEFRSDSEKQACLESGIRVVSDDLKTFADTAALIETLDLVITVDTSVAHLAGALGKPVWILLQYSPDFRWLLDRSDSPWYPTARLFRQRTFGDWGPVISEVQSALACVASATPIGLGR